MSLELGVLITLVTLVVGLGFWAGKIQERVGNNRYDIAEGFRENKEEHKEIIKLIKNGGR